MRAKTHRARAGEGVAPLLPHLRGHFRGLGQLDPIPVPHRHLLVPQFPGSTPGVTVSTFPSKGTPDTKLRGQHQMLELDS